MKKANIAAVGLAALLMAVVFWACQKSSSSSGGVPVLTLKGAAR